MTRNELSRVNKTNHRCVSVMKKAARAEERNKVRGERRGGSVYVWGFLWIIVFPPFFSNCYIFIPSFFITLAGPGKKRGDRTHFSVLHIHKKPKNMQGKAACFLGNCVCSVYELTLNIKLSLNIWLCTDMDKIIAPPKQLPAPFEAKTLAVLRDDGHTSVNLKCPLKLNQRMHACMN